MISKSNNQKNDVAVLPQKLYTQNQVDDLLEKSEEVSPSLADQIGQEVLTSNKRKRTNKKNIAQLVKKSNRILVGISSHALPFDFFPTTINVEEGRVTIIRRNFLSSQVHSIDIKNISNIFINRTVFFSQLVIISKTYEENEIKIRNLHNNDAIFARRIIEGLRTFESKQIDTSGYSIDELIAKLEELSTTEIVT